MDDGLSNFLGHATSVVAASMMYAMYYLLPKCAIPCTFLIGMLGAQDLYYGLSNIGNSRYVWYNPFLRAVIGATLFNIGIVLLETELEFKWSAGLVCVTSLFGIYLHHNFVDV